MSVELTKTEKNIYKKHLEKVQYFRTVIIEGATTLETQLEWIISSYFSKDSNNYALFNYLFFGENIQLGFHDKILMFEKLLGTSMKDVHKKYPDLLTKLNRIRKVRNRFAHSETQNSNPKKIKLMKKQIFLILVEKGEVKEVDYTFVFIKEVIKDFFYLNRIFGKKIRELKLKNHIYLTKKT